MLRETKMRDGFPAPLQEPAVMTRNCRVSKGICFFALNRKEFDKYPLEHVCMATNIFVVEYIIHYFFIFV